VARRTLDLLTGAARADEFAAVLDDLVAAARQILGDRFVGAYLHGSLAQGDADLESDADFLIITDGPVDEEQFVALARLHHRLAHGESHWTRHLEGSYAVAAELRSRMVAAHETGQVLSKRAGAGWAATQWGGEFAPLLEAMVAARGATAFDDPADPAWIPQQHAFFAAVAARSGS